MMSRVAVGSEERAFVSLYDGKNFHRLPVVFVLVEDVVLQSFS